MIVKTCTFILGLTISLSVLASAPVSSKDLSAHVEKSISKVQEFNFIKAQAEKMGLRVYLFGGTAASFLHYVKWDLERINGNSQYLSTRFDFDFTNIFRSTQDLDIVVDGSIENAAAFQRILMERYPQFVGSKAEWEVRTLRHAIGQPGSPKYKEALLNDFDFLNQNSDSNSTGLIELTAPDDKQRIRDLRNWDSKTPIFLSDASAGKITFYRSPRHFETTRAKQGTNPEIFSAIRFLTKAFQYDVAISAKDASEIQDIVNQFKKSDIGEGYAHIRFIEIAKKLFKHAVNLDYAWSYLEKIGLRSKLQTFDDPNTLESLAWWMNREPIPAKPMGEGTGKTAKELGLDIVAHETTTMLAFESITRSNLGAPNVFKSRQGMPGERAVFGDGFYVRVGRKGAVGTGLTVRFRMNENAREGTDFKVADGGDYIVILNKNAFSFIDEHINMSLVEYFKQIMNDENFGKNDLGLIEKFKRKTNYGIQPRDLAELNSYISNYYQQLKYLSTSHRNEFHKHRAIEIMVKEYISITKDKGDFNIINPFLKDYYIHLGLKYLVAQFSMQGFSHLAKEEKIEALWKLLKNSNYRLGILEIVLTDGKQNSFFEDISLQPVIAQFKHFNKVEILNSFLLKLKNGEFLDEYRGRLDKLPNLFFEIQKDPSKYPEFLELCSKLGIRLLPKIQHSHFIGPHFKQWSQIDRIIAMKALVKAEMDLVPTRYHEVLSNFAIGSSLTDALGIPSNPEIKTWLDQGSRFDLLSKILSDDEITFHGVDMSPYAERGSLIVKLIRAATQMNEPNRSSILLFLKRHFADLKELGLESLPLNLRSSLLYIPAEERKSAFEALFLNLIAIEATNLNSSEPFPKVLKSYFDFISMGQYEPQFLAEHKPQSFFYFENYNEHYFSRPQLKSVIRDLEAFRKQSKEILNDPENAAKVYDFFIEIQKSNPGFQTPFKNGQAFVRALKSAQSIKMAEPYYSKENNNFDDRNDNKIKIVSRVIFYSVAAINFLLAQEYPQVQSNELSLFIQEILYLNIGFHGLRVASIGLKNYIMDYITYWKVSKFEKRSQIISTLTKFSWKAATVPIKSQLRCETLL